MAAILSSPKKFTKKSPSAPEPSQLAQELATLGYVRPDTPRNRAHLLVSAVTTMIQNCVREQGSLVLLSEREREERTQQLAESLRSYHWEQLGFDRAAVLRVLDPEKAELLVTRILGGESLRFLEDLFYEHFIAIDRLGDDADKALPALRLANYRRRRPPEHVHSSRRVSRLPA